MYKINFCNYVDHIFCNTYLPLNRLNKMIRRFENIGIDIYDSHLFNFEYGIENGLFVDNIKQYVKNNNYKFNNSYNYKPYIFELGLQIYHICKISKYMKYNKIIIFEDDIAFFSNHKYIENALDYICQQNFDIVHCDSNFLRMYRGIPKYLKTLNIIDKNDNRYFYKFINYNSKNITIYGGGFVILSYKAINKIIQMIEDKEVPMGLDMLYTWIFDEYMKDLNIYMAKTPLGIQDILFELSKEELDGINIYMDINDYEQ